MAMPYASTVIGVLKAALATSRELLPYPGEQSGAREAA